MEDHAVAAAILVQTVFSSDERMQTLLKGHTVPGSAAPVATANFLKPWYAAMLRMVTDARR